MTARLDLQTEECCNSVTEHLQPTYRPLRVEQDVCELQHQRVGGLVVRFLQGVRKELWARWLDDHLRRRAETLLATPTWYRDEGQDLNQRVLDCLHLAVQNLLDWGLMGSNNVTKRGGATEEV